jgi:tyrosyl-tRNA synthetase
VHLLATPLVTKADGTKFGKTESGTVWLDGGMTSPYAFYQFWLNAEDVKVAEYLRYFTFRSREEVDDLERATRERPAGREAQRVLAAEVTDIVHGEQARRRVEEASRALFGGGELEALDASALADALAELPLARLPRREHPVADLFAATGLVASKSAARRAVSEGGAYVNNRRIEDPDAVVGPTDLLHGRWLLLRRGRRSLGAVELTHDAHDQSR